MILGRTCQQIAELLIAREDRAIGIKDSVALRLHVLACKNCPDFEQQILTMRKALRHWRDDTDEQHSL